MPTVQNVTDPPRPVDLTGGAVLAPRELAIVDTALPHEADQISRGNLRVVDPDTLPPLTVAEEFLIGVFSGAAQGDVVIRGADGWKRVPAGSTGRVLTTRGPGQDAEWSRVDVPDLDFDVATQTELDAAVAAEATTRAAADAGKAQALAATTVKTAAYTAAAGDLIPVDATAGGVPITLPTAPADKTRIAVKLIAVSGTNTVTIARGGTTDVFNKAGGSTSLTLKLLNEAVSLQYAAATGVWYVQSTDVPLTQLDARYPQKSTSSADQGKFLDAYTGLPQSVESAVLVPAGASDSAVRAIFAGLTAGQRVVFEGTAYSITDSLTISVPDVFVDARRAAITITTDGRQVFDIPYGSDRVKIRAKSLVGTGNKYAGFGGAGYVYGSDPGWDPIGDTGANSYRGERRSNRSAGFYCNAAGCDLACPDVHGFYVGAFLFPWNGSSTDTPPNYRDSNKVNVGVSDVFTGIGYGGQKNGLFRVRGSYVEQPGDGNPPHAIYGISSAPSLGCEVDGHATNGGGSGEWQTLAFTGTWNNGDTFTLQAGSIGTTAAITYNSTVATLKSNIQTALRALTGLANKVWVYYDSGTTAFQVIYDPSVTGVVSPQSSLIVGAVSGAGTSTTTRSQGGGNGWAFQFKQQTNLRGRLHAENCPGSVLFASSTDCHVELLSDNDLLANTGSIVTQSDCTDVTVKGKVNVNATPATNGNAWLIANVNGTDNAVDLVIRENYATVDSATVYAVSIPSTATGCDAKIRYRNSGTGGRVVVSLDGTNNSVEVAEAINVYAPVNIASTVVGPNVVKVNAKRTTWTGTGVRWVIDARTGALTHEDTFSLVSPIKPTLATTRVEATCPYWRITLSTSAATISNPHAPYRGARIVFELNNLSNGSPSGALTWDTQFKLASALASVAAGTIQYIEFGWDSSQSKWREFWRQTST